ncbi:MAG: hypothetical protein QOJ86_3877 [Bradyrhizobium sp.]|jgi:uncharacterized damage-inducible protein DinB|nr:hypothetical protein [Bradyrhizobium sp.]
MKSYFEQRAAYNRWANARLYEAALSLSEADYRRDVGAFFKSMHGTLNHLLLTDRLWLKRLTGEGEHPNQLNAIIYEDRRALALARADEDAASSRMSPHLTIPRSRDCKNTRTHRARSSNRSGAIFSPTCSTTRPIIAARPTPFCRSAPAKSRPSSIYC